MIMLMISKITTMRIMYVLDIMSITMITTMSVDVAADMTTITIITIMQMMCLQAGARRLLTSIQKKSWI